MKILSLMKKNIWMLLLAIILLAIQAFGIVALPEYISKIVDVGIRSYGIENAVPIAIRESEIENLKLFIKNKEVLNNFEVMGPKEFINLGISNLNEKDINEKIYVLKENAEVQKVNLEFKRAIIILQVVNKSDSIVGLRKELDGFITKKFQVFSGSDSDNILEIIKTLNKEKLSIMNSLIDDQLKMFTEDIFMQASAEYLNNEYKILGMQSVQTTYIIKVVIEMIVIAFTIFVAYIIEAYIMSKFSAETTADIRSQMFEQILKMENEDYDNFSITSLINRTVFDTQIIQKNIVLAIRTLVYIPIIFIGAYYKIQKLSNGFENSLIFIGLIVFIIGAIIYVIIIPKIKKIQVLLDTINSTVRDGLNNIFIIKGSGRKKYETNFQNVNKEITQENTRVLDFKFFATIIMRLAVYLAGVYILWRGGISIEAGALGLGSLMAIIEYLFQISFSSIDILRSSMELVKGYVSYKRCINIFATKIKEEKNLKGIENIETIEFKNVYFKYPKSKEYILNDFSMKIEENDHIAIIGKNASGKSTIIKLLLKLYNVEKGQILINGININKINTKKLREKMGVVLQENNVFSGMLDDNIKFGNEKIKNEEIKKIKEIIELTEFDTDNKKISYKGKNISGGQKQRIAIARVLAKDANVLILDNAFSSLDENTKQSIQKNIINKFGNKIIIEICQEKNNIFDYTKIVEL